MSDLSQVIDWQEAMDQCGDDEDFLRELLSDLRGEVDAQLVKIDDALKNVDESTFLLIMRASHVIKGASSNLMCQELREAATNLEQSAADGNQSGSEETTQVREKFAVLQKAADNYHKFLDSIGI